MSIKDLDLQPVYDTEESIINFYNQVLPKAKIYKRVSAYIDSSSFSYISKGLKEFIKGDGYMQLVISPDQISPKTYEDIKSGYKERVNRGIKKALRYTEMLENSDLPLFAFLISIGRLDIKVAIKEYGILHEKFGIIIDHDNNELLFSGSNNETSAALVKNQESFEVTTSWLASPFDVKKIAIRKENFESYWNNTKKNFIVLDIPDAIKNDLLKIVNQHGIPKDIKNHAVLIDLNNENKLQVKANFSLLSLRGHYQFRWVINLIESYKGDEIIFQEINHIKDYNEIKTSFVTLSNELGFEIFYGKKFQDFIDARTLDLPLLSNKGMHIKNPSFLHSDEFLNYEKNINSLIKRPLRKAQLISTIQIIELKRAMNFSVPGSGKTASVLGAFFYLKSLGLVERLIVFGPISSFKSWADEYNELSPKANSSSILNTRKFSDRSLKIAILEYDFQKYDLILINFEQLSSISSILQRFIDYKCMIVLDEVHRLKRIDGIRYKEASRLVKNTKYRVALTGTPLPNGYVDLHNLFEILFDDYARTYFDFTVDRLRKTQDRYARTGQEDLSVNRIIYPFYSRVTKKELQIPDPNEDNIILVTPTDEENQTYSRIYNLDSSDFGSINKIIRLLRVGCCKEMLDFNNDYYDVLVGNDEDNTFTEKPGDLSSKILATINLTKTLLAENKSVIIWAVFRKTISNLEHYLRKLGIECKSIYGSVEAEAREEIINSFNNGNLKVLITNLQTLAESVSLHKKCHDAIYVELNFNLSQYLQSRDRIHRLGIRDDQDTNYYLLFNNYKLPSIERVIYTKLKEKEQLMISAIEQGDIIFKYDFDISEIERIIRELRVEK